MIDVFRDHDSEIRDFADGNRNAGQGHDIGVDAKPLHAMFWGSAGGRSVRHARDYRNYARQAPTIAPSLTQHEAAGVSQNITAAQRQFAEVRKTTTDKQAITSLDAIDKQIVVAAKAHANMHEMCHMEKIDAEGTMKCCSDVDASLEKAMAEHKELMKHLDGEPAEVPASK